MSTKKTARLAALSFVPVITLLTGCAVLTIDVDVYKGILSTERTTQIAHLAALAPASRSLMVQMFNDLDVNKEILRIRLDEDGAGFYVPNECVGTGDGWKRWENWEPLKRRQAADLYPLNLKGDALAQQRVALRLAYIIGLFDPITNKDTPPDKRASEKSTPDNSTPATTSTKPADLSVSWRKGNLPYMEGALKLASQALIVAEKSRNATQGGKAADQSKDGPSNEEAYNNLRGIMSAIANEIVLLQQMGDFGQIGFFPRVQRAVVSVGRNGGRPATSDALMLLQAIGNSIFAITDELANRDTWERQTHKKALVELRAVLGALTSDTFSRGQIWVAHAAEKKAIALERLENLKRKKTELGDEIKELRLKLDAAPDDEVLKKKVAELQKKETALNTDREDIEKLAENAADFEKRLRAFAKEYENTAATVDGMFDALSKTDWVAAFRDEVKALKDLPHKLHIPALPELSSEDVTQGEVRDAIVATIKAYRLRYLLLTSNGDEAARAQTRASIEQIDSALRFLEEGRAESIPLRPAGAILRTVTPITAFQGNAPRSAGNMLTQFALDSIPIAGPAIKSVHSRIASPNHNPDLELRLDREFWQPINHIEVQGTGKTNYVVVKDPVGNWFVKSYSADPSKAMQTFSRFISNVYVPGKGLAAGAASAVRTNAASPGMASAALADEVKGREDSTAAKYGAAITALKTAVSGLSKDATDITAPKAELLTKELADIETKFPDKPKERAQAFINLGKDYGLQRLAAAAQSSEAASNDLGAKEKTLTWAESLLENASEGQRTKLKEERDKAETAKNAAATKAKNAKDELAASSAAFDEFKKGTKAFFEARTLQLAEDEKFYRDKLLATIDSGM